MDIIKAHRTETITQSEAIKMFSSYSSNNYLRIVKNYIQFTIDNDMDCTRFTRDLYLDTLTSDSTKKVYRSAINKFMNVCDQFKVIKIVPDVMLQKRTKLTHTLESYAEMYLSEIQHEATAITYRKALKQFIQYMDDSASAFNKATVIKWTQQLISSDMSVYTVNLILTVIRQFVKHIIDQADVIFKDQPADKTAGIIKELNRITSIKNLKTQRDFHKDSFTADEIQLLLTAADTDLKAIIALMYYAGLRTIEIQRLHASDIDLVNNIMFIHGKGRHDKELKPMPDTLTAILASYLNGRTTGQLITDINTSKIRHAVNKLLTSTGLKKKVKKCSAHSFRHSYIQHLVSKDIPLHIVQKMARHKSITSTEFYFRKLQDEQLMTEYRNVI